ncbi:class I SAM-dependent methyltransferase [Sulfurimonas sp. HSL-3221]|uniref:class I SAM-dependent methyltransferase n=1 Tax=Sulfurimonadaceae TaxID=2771471 RepID=UPI001E499230|nr:class I SAM-dependent methyltransferase [Sulfurimonas sp. HSL-3221]UFS62587.1 class I SAM-dependent methyltransferase [Sulfurimonas sp. HSL-3221]
MNATHSKKHKGAGDPSGFDAIVREVFAPIYPVIASQIIQQTQTTRGVCLDAGCGTGALGRAMARLSGCEVTFFDQSEKMLEFARGYADAEAITARSRFLQGDIHDIPLPSESVDLVISRGSSPFWDDQKRAYSEILRVLRRGGRAYVGGGFGSAELREQIVSTMLEREPNWEERFKHRSKAMRDALPQILERLQPASFEIINDESGFWAHICK